ncbi:hypothetical protein NPIL_243661 [Nephila pilipes]|uniref:Uncharacterized protein n=1 Tax=Nephila pilipes TaxID=299642 RepID=A0A8X6UFQ0_NEPPI|nr:hypothetical protein NPIL_243661 [Nephila pilipes]
MVAYAENTRKEGTPRIKNLRHSLRFWACLGVYNSLESHHCLIEHHCVCGMRFPHSAALHTLDAYPLPPRSSNPSSNYLYINIWNEEFVEECP